jgi:predicted nucleic acid-binding protein
MRIFLDANILFSAAKSDGAVRRLLELLADAGHECHADSFVVEEARRNLALKAPGNLPVLHRLLGRIKVAQAASHPPEAEVVRSLPEKDRPVLAAAIQLACEALVTGDRAHFGSLYGKTLGGVKIHSPRSLAEAVLK